jgi:hypothetical protein
MQQLASQALLQANSTANPPVDPMAMGQASKPGSILEENDYVQHEAFNLNSGSQGAMQDAQMIRSQPLAGPVHCSACAAIGGCRVLNDAGG